MFDYLAARKEADRSWRRYVALALAGVAHLGIVAAALDLSARPPETREPEPTRIGWPGPKTAPRHDVVPIQPGKALTPHERKPARSIHRLKTMPTQAPTPAQESKERPEQTDEIATGPASNTGMGDGASGQGDCDGPDCTEGAGDPNGTGPGVGGPVGDLIVFPGKDFAKPHLASGECLAESIHIPVELHGVANRVLVRFAVEPGGEVSHFSFPMHVPDPRIEAAVIAGIQACTWIAGTDPRGDRVAMWVVQPIRLE